MRSPAGLIEEHVVIAEMVPEPLGPVVEGAVVAGVVGIVVNRVELIALAFRVRILQ